MPMRCVLLGMGNDVTRRVYMDHAAGKPVASEVLEEMLPYFTALESGQYVQYVKASLEILGKPIGAPRKPLLRPAEEDYRRLEGLLRALSG